MVNYNGREETGKGGQFKEERTSRNSRRSGSADSVAGIAGFTDTVERVIAAGAYISFGRTTDGGATLIRVLDGDAKLTSYCNSRQDILEALAALDNRYPEEERLPMPIAPPARYTAPDGTKKQVK